MVELLGAPPPSGLLTCSACDRDLAAYVDLERAAGTRAALMAFPTVWWHLWTCADCGETYRLMSALLDAERDGTLVPLPLLQPAPPPRLRPIERFYLPRVLFNHTLAPQASLGSARGDDEDEDETVLADSESSGYQITLSVQRQADGSWSVTVATEPPVTGRVVLTLGTMEITTSFDSLGMAVFVAIPHDLLTAPDGPDMIVVVEAESTDGEA